MTCQNCGSTHLKNFCPECGEKKFTHHDLTLKHFFHETLESFLHFDNKFLRSLKMLLFKPGKLTVNFSEGKRVSFMRPLQLFLVLNICLFIIPGNPFSLPLYNYITYKPFVDYHTQEIISAKIADTQTTMAEYSAHFNEKIKSDSKLYIFLYIPFYALAFYVLFFFKKRLLTEHLIFATHFMSFFIALAVLNWLFTMPIFYLMSIKYSSVVDNVDTMIIQLILFVYSLLAVRRFYQTNWIWSILTSALTAGSFFVVIQVYRMMLFHKIVGV